MTETELKSRLEDAAKSPQRIAAAVTGLPPKTLLFKPAPEKWSILEILAHLVDMEILYAYRMRQMLADKKPVIAPVNQDDWAKNLHYTEESAPELVALFGLNRHHNLRLLRRIQLSDFEKSAYHPELQRDVTVTEYIEMMARHGPNHLRQIEQLKKQAG